MVYVSQACGSLRCLSRRSGAALPTPCSAHGTTTWRLPLCETNCRSVARRMTMTMSSRTRRTRPRSSPMASASVHARRSRGTDAPAPATLGRGQLLVQRAGDVLAQRLGAGRVLADTCAGWPSGACRHMCEWSGAVRALRARGVQLCYRCKTLVTRAGCHGQIVPSPSPVASTGGC